MRTEYAWNLAIGIFEIWKDGENLSNFNFAKQESKLKVKTGCIVKIIVDSIHKVLIASVHKGKVNRHYEHIFTKPIEARRYYPVVACDLRTCVEML